MACSSRLLLRIVVVTIYVGKLVDIHFASKLRPGDEWSKEIRSVQALALPCLSSPFTRLLFPGQGRTRPFGRLKAEWLFGDRSIRQWSGGPALDTGVGLFIAWYGQRFDQAISALRAQDIAHKSDGTLDEKDNPQGRREKRFLELFRQAILAVQTNKRRGARAEFRELDDGGRISFTRSSDGSMDRLLDELHEAAEDLGIQSWGRQPDSGNFDAKNRIHLWPGPSTFRGAAGAAILEALQRSHSAKQPSKRVVASTPRSPGQTLQPAPKDRDSAKPGKRQLLLAA